MPNGVWRHNPQQQALLHVIPRSDVLHPNCIRADADGSKLYVTDTSPPTYGSNSWAVPAVFEYDLDTDVRPVNKRVVALPRSQFADGIHLDDARRLWTAEADGINVRSSQGKLLGIFNAAPLKDPRYPALANFALAGNTLVLLAFNRIWRLTLAATVVAPGNLS